jgi:O-antigen/teichoic acid export membrane protein
MRWKNKLPHNQNGGTHDGKQRIAKNTMMLYFRQILIMLVSLYTVRVVLNTLGEEDYGIYNVVAGVVTMFGFLSGAMTSATQRYFSFAIGQGDYKQLQKTFNLSLIIYIIIGVLVLLFSETIGLWFLHKKLLISMERIGAARFVYQFSIISFLLTLITTPYMAIIIAYENMDIYAYVGILEAILKLGIVYILQLRIFSFDLLKLYGFLLFFVTFTHTVVYRVICNIKYHECKFVFYFDGKLLREITSYTGWNLFGSFVGIFRIQMINILMNQFFGPLVIASRSIALTVNNAVGSFSSNFSIAIHPQIIKNYAARQESKMLSLVFYGSKFTYLLVYLFALPLLVETPMILTIWLKNLPEHVILFTRLAVIDVLIDSISYPIVTAAQATGKIRLYQSIVGSILLLNLPVSWIFLLFGAPAYSVMYVAICISLTAFMSRIIILKRLIKYSLVQFIKTVIIPILIISLVSVILPIILCFILEQSFFRLFIVVCTSIFFTCGFVYLVGLNKIEKKMIKKAILNKFNRLNKNDTCR